MIEIPPPSAPPFDKGELDDDLAEAEDEAGFAKPVSYETKTASLVLHFDRALLPGAALHGSWRSNPGQVVPWDCMRFPMLAFYALPITNA